MVLVVLSEVGRTVFKVHPDRDKGAAGVVKKREGAPSSGEEVSIKQKYLKGVSDWKKSQQE